MAKEDQKDTPKVQTPVDANGSEESFDDTIVEPSEGSTTEEMPSSPYDDVDEAEGMTLDGTIDLSEIDQLRQELELAQSKADEHYDRLQRVTAEFQNSKRRQEKMLSDSIARASQRMVEKLLPVLDDLDLAFRNVPAELSEGEESWLNGFQQIQKKLLVILEDEDVTVIPLEGAFNPEQHEAISSEPNDEVESGEIIETVRQGYEQKGRVLRPALVRVAI